MPVSDENIVPCKQCRIGIPHAARLCSHCNSYQDWRGHLTVSSSVLALLVALISVTTTALPVVSSALSDPQSQSLVSRPVFQGVKLTVAVSNVGNGPAVFRDGSISSSFLSPGPVALRLQNATDSFIKVGSQPLTLDIDWKRDAVDAASVAVEMQKIQNNPASADAGFSKIVVLETDGREKEFKYPISAYDVRQIAEAKFAICKEVKPSSDPKCSSSFGAGGDY